MEFYIKNKPFSVRFTRKSEQQNIFLKFAVLNSVKAVFFKYDLSI